MFEALEIENSLKIVKLKIENSSIILPFYIVIFHFETRLAVGQVSILNC